MSRILTMSRILAFTLVLAASLIAAIAQESPPTTQPSTTRATATQPATTQAERRGRFFTPVVPEQTKRAPTLERTLGPLATSVRPSVAGVLLGNNTLILATVVRSDGYLVTKASELRAGALSIRLASGVTQPAKLVGVVQAHDLALLKVEAANLQPVTWASKDTIRVGRFVLTVGESNSPLGVGVVSVAQRPTVGGMIGVQLRQTDEGILVAGLSEGLPAEKAGIKPGDYITHINDEAYDEQTLLSDFLQSQPAGTEVSVTVRRGEETLVFRMALARRSAASQSARSMAQNTMGGELSARRGDFPAIIQHDCVVQPRQQGTPLVDLDGQVIGVNIARAGRVETYALPGTLIEELLPDLIAGKYPAELPAPPSPTTQTSTRPSTRPATQPATRP
jgi:serine protease Do